MIENPDIIRFIIFAFCVAGATYTAYMRGVVTGAENTILILEESEIIKVNENGDIVPYK